MVRACKKEDPTRPAVTGIETSCLFYRLFSWTDLAYHDLQFFYRLLSWAKIPTKNIQISVTLLLHFIYKNNYFLPLQAVPDFCVTMLVTRLLLWCALWTVLNSGPASGHSVSPTSYKPHLPETRAQDSTKGSSQLKHHVESYTTESCCGLSRKVRNLLKDLHQLKELTHSSSQLRNNFLLSCRLASHPQESPCHRDSLGNQASNRA